MRYRKRWYEITCDTCGNEYTYTDSKIREIMDRRKNELVTGTVCPYCKRINEHKGNKR